MTEPTDDEIAALRSEFGITSNGRGIKEFTQVRDFARAVLAKWRAQPAVVGEPVAWLHDCAALLTNDVELWIDACPHCGKPRKHAAPQPAVAAGREQIAEAALCKVLAAVQRYLPPDGPSAEDTLSEIIGIVDPWPLAAGEVQWIGASSHAHLPPAPSTEGESNG